MHLSRQELMEGVSPWPKSGLGKSGLAKSGLAKSGLGWIGFPGRGRVRSARAHLLAFGAALVVPVLVLAALLAWLYVDAERRRADESARSFARQLLLAVDRELAAPIQMLQALATSPLLQKGDLQAFHERASQISRGLGITIVLRAPDNSPQLVNTSVPWGTPLKGGNPGIPSFEAEAARTGRPVVSDLLLGPMHDIWVVAVMIPVPRDGKPVYFLSVGLPAERIAEVLREVRLEPGWFSAVADRKNVIVARSVDHGRFVGKTAPRGWVERATGTEGIWTGRNLEGVPVRTAYVRSDRTGWVIAVSAPESVLNAPMRQALLTLGLVAAALLTLTLSLAYRSGAGLSGSIQTLTGTAASVFHGRPVEPIATSVREVNEVAAALSAAAGHAASREAHLRSILDTVPSAMVVADSRGVIRSFSRTAERLFGYPAAEAVGANVTMLMPDPDRTAHHSYIAHHLSTGERRIIGTGRVVSAVRKDGTVIPVELYIGEADTDGETIFTAFLRDQSEKRRIEQELRQTQKMEAIGKLTGGVAHDFNNLLTVIKGNLEMLDARLEGEDLRELLGDAQEAADLAAQLTAGLLAFGRRMPLDPRLVDAGQLVSATGDLLRRTLGETIQVRTVVDSTCDVLVDAHQLQNAILNLGINARDAMPDGGKLTIAVSHVAPALGDAATKPEAPGGGHVLIALTDNGTGMTPEARERAFEPFFTTKPSGVGSGLGLSTVYGFVRQSGGDVTIESELGRGTTVRIYLPCAAGGGRAAAAPVVFAASTPRSKGETILLVEDEIRVRRVTAARLKELGYNVLEAENGVEALEALAREPAVALLFTDMIMPGGMNGAQLAAQAQNAYPALRVLFTSGYADPEMVKEAEGRSGDWLIKPYRVAELARKLRAALDQAPPAAPTA